MYCIPYFSWTCNLYLIEHEWLIYWTCKFIRFHWTTVKCRFQLELPHWTIYISQCINSYWCHKLFVTYVSNWNIDYLYFLQEKDLHTMTCSAYKYHTEPLHIIKYYELRDTKEAAIIKNSFNCLFHISMVEHDAWYTI